MQVETVRARHKRDRLLEVLPQFLRRPRLARIIAGDGQSPAQLLPGPLETADVVTLPAMDGNRDSAKLFDSSLSIHAQFGIPFSGQFVRFFDVLGLAHNGFAQHRHVVETLSSAELTIAWPGHVHSVSNSPSRCAPGRRAVRTATGPRSQHPGVQEGVREFLPPPPRSEPLRAGTARGPERDRSPVAAPRSAGGGQDYGLAPRNVEKSPILVL